MAKSKFIQAKPFSRVTHVSAVKKVCIRCHQERDIEQFHKRPKAPDGRRAECNICSEIYAKPRRDKKKKEIDFYKQFMPI